MKQTLLWFTLIAATALAACERNAPAPGAAAGADLASEPATGPRGGRLLADGDFMLELAIFETGTPPEYRAWASVAGRPIEPAEVDLAVELARTGGVVDRVGFAPAGDYLRGDREIDEPHSFDVSVTARHGAQTHRWAYESHEGRTVIPADVAAAAGIEAGVAGPGVIVETASLYGFVTPDPTRVREVAARFPGVIRGVQAQIGERVAAGAALATVESNESLQLYTVTAPIAGTIVRRHAEPGEQTSGELLFEITDFSTVWVELGVFPRDRARVRIGQTVRMRGDGGAVAQGTVAYVAPVGDRATQSVAARVVLDNADGLWSAGQFIEAAVTVAETEVALAVPLAAVQTFRDFDVVYARFGDVYEVRMLELGRRDTLHVEVRGGLMPGTEFVTENSYLVKADVEKSGASHDH